MTDNTTPAQMREAAALLPCPFCAGEAHIYTTSQDSDTSVTAQCKECGAEMNFWLPWTAGDGQKAQAWQDVLNRWNTRAEKAKAERDALRAAQEEIADGLKGIARDIQIGPDDEGREIYEMVQAIRDDARAALKGTSE